MRETRVRFRFTLAALAAACLVAMSPLSAMAAGGPGDPQQPPPGAGSLVVQKVENGPAFGIEFKFTEINKTDVYLLGGYAGYTFDNKLFVGGAGYWQVDDYWNDYYYADDYYYGDCYHGCGGYGGYDGYHAATGYGGLVVEWFPLRTSVVSVSARGLVGGGVTSVGWDDYAYIQEPSPHHGSVYPPAYGYYWYDQGYFVFEPQVNVGVRIVPGLSLVAGAGYRVIGWADGWEDQIGGFTGSVAIRFGR
jgi:hypothetical protein